MDTIEASYRITTPMFLAGADQRQAELRLPSFKGALRFWWRSLMWRKVKDCGELRGREAALFGSAEPNTGQSKVRLQLVSQELESVVPARDVFEGGRLLGAHYLGYGVMEAFASKRKGTKAGELTRSMIPGGSFTVACTFHPSLEKLERDQLIAALILLGTVGGLGSKSRKGYGSLTLTQLSPNQQSVSLDPTGRLKDVLKTLPPDQPDWTAFSQASRVITVSSNARKPVELLDLMGREQVFYRSWGNGGTVLGQQSEKNFEEDHDLHKSPAEGKYPRRTVFGLPHNYGKYPSDEVAPSSDNLDRRASPLFLHIHQVSSSSAPNGLVVFLPSRFLPDGRIRAFGKEAVLDETHQFWQPTHGYLDRLIGKAGATKKKTQLQAQEVPLG